MLESSFELLVALKKLRLMDDKPNWWWRGAGSFEVVLGAILVQNTQWKNVEQMLDSMRRTGILCADSETNLNRFANLDVNVLASHIIGLQRQKSTRIIALSRAIREDFGSFSDFSKYVECEWLVRQKGIWLESAYAILNYACLREVMVVDRYTYKLLSALGQEISDYEALRSFCEQGIRDNIHLVYELYPKDMSLAQIFARFHGKIVEFNKAKLSYNTLVANE